MRLIILTICLSWLSSSAIVAQNYDSLKNEILKIKADQADLHLNLMRSHSKFRRGTIFFVSGIVVTGAFLVSEFNSADGGGPLMGIIGFGLTTVGVAMHIDSHKWIGKAAKTRK